MTEPFSGLAPLATVNDAARFGYNLGASGANLLDRASVRVRSYSRQAVTRVVNDVATLRPINGSVLLTQRPCDQPTALVVVDAFGNSYTSTYWGWNGRRVECPHVVKQTRWFDYAWFPYAPNFPYPFGGVCLCVATKVQVTYSHGFTAVPDDVVDIVCAVAQRLANTDPSMDGGVRTHTTGGVSVTFQRDALTLGGGLTAGERETLDRIFGRPSRFGTIQL